MKDLDIYQGVARVIYCIYKNNKDYTRSPVTYYAHKEPAQKFADELNAELASNNIDNENYYVSPIALIED